MKKLSILFVGLISNFIFAQCEISGNSHINVNETATYSIGNELAQCKQCHQWNVVGKADIIGDRRQNKISIKPTSQGTLTLSLQYFSSQGLVQCSKDIVVSHNNTPHKDNSNINENRDCNIDLENYKETKIDSNMVIFYPNTQQNLIYAWEANYQDGSKAVSSEKVPQFYVSEENPIVNVHIKVFSKSCYKKLIKTYDKNFWKHLK